MPNEGMPNLKRFPTAQMPSVRSTGEIARLRNSGAIVCPFTAGHRMDAMGTASEYLRGRRGGRLFRTGAGPD